MATMGSNGAVDHKACTTGHARHEKGVVTTECSDVGLMSLAVTAYTSFVSDFAEERREFAY
jgi:hypothetical protein